MDLPSMIQDIENYKINIVDSATLGIVNYTKCMSEIAQRIKPIDEQFSLVLDAKCRQVVSQVESYIRTVTEQADNFINLRHVGQKEDFSDVYSVVGICLSTWVARISDAFLHLPEQTKLKLEEYGVFDYPGYSPRTDGISDIFEGLHLSDSKSV